MLRLKSKKVNPGRSNKLVWAVAAGLAIVLILWVILTTGGRRPRDRRELMRETLDYLRTTDGIVEVQVDPAAPSVRILYDPTFAGDFPKIAHFAAVRLAAKVPDFVLEMAAVPQQMSVYRAEVRHGRIVSEGPSR